MSVRTAKQFSVRASDFRGAFKLHKQFREPLKKDRVRTRVMRINTPSVLMVQGTVESISYRTTHGGKVVLYKHDFAAGSRPFLASGPKKNQVFLVGGRYHVTDRGIVDLDAHGVEIEDHVHGEEIPENE